MRIDGKAIAQNILNDLKQKPAPKKFLAVFVVGNDVATASFIKQKEKAAKDVGIDFRIYAFDKSITSDQLREKIHTVADGGTCGGVLVQLPLPEHINARYVANAIPPHKDIDCLGERMRGDVAHNRSLIVPPAVAVVEEIVNKQEGGWASLETIAVVGQGFLVGAPITAYFKGKVKNVLALDKGFDVAELKKAGLVVCGAGVPGLVKASMLKEGAGVIDFGYGTTGEGTVSGDFDVVSLKEMSEDFVRFYTPTPGGTGPILVASLMRNFYTINK